MNLKLSDLKHRSIPMEKIILLTENTKDGYIAKCVVNDKELLTAPKPAPYAAVEHLINVVVERKKAQGQTRDLHYIFIVPPKT